MEEIELICLSGSMPESSQPLPTHDARSSPRLIRRAAIWVVKTLVLLVVFSLADYLARMD